MLTASPSLSTTNNRERVPNTIIDMATAQSDVGEMIPV